MEQQNLAKDYRENDKDICQAVMDVAEKNEPKTLTIDYILYVVCKYFKISREQLFQPTKKREIAYMRMIAMYFAYWEVKCTDSQIATEIGGKERTTSIHGRNKISGLIEVDHVIREYVFDIKSMLETGEWRYKSKELCRKTYRKSTIGKQIQKIEPKAEVVFIRPKGEYSNLRETNDPTFQTNSFRINKY